MNRRVVFGGLLSVVCLAILWGVWGQRSQLDRLRAEQQQLQAQLAGSDNGSASSGSAEVKDASSGTPPPTLVATPELLRLRNEVTRLTERRQELAGERAENERLRGQLASRSTNGTVGSQLPAGYVRKSEARMVGYSTPDDTLQTLMWAIRNRDLTNVLQAFAPDRATDIRGQAGDTSQSLDEFFSKTWGLVGMRIVKREPDASDGSIAVEVEVVPGESGPRIIFRQTNGQWKIAGPF
jgi:hypothetical protein